MYNSIQTTYVGDGDYENLVRSIQQGNQPFKYVDYLYIAFADLNKDSLTIEFNSEFTPRMENVIKLANQQNPNIRILVQMGWASGLAPLDTNEKIDIFTQSIPGLLKKYGFRGIDYDWESVPPGLNASYLFAQTKARIGSDRYLSISPDTTQSLDPEVINANVSFVNVQSYQRLGMIDTFIALGIHSNLINVGMASENDDPNGFYPPGGGIADYIQKCVDVKAGGLYSWRIDNDDTDHVVKVPRYTITKQMWQFTSGVIATDIGGADFDDTDMGRNYDGSPRQVPAITGMTVRSGDVLNAVQTNNGDLILPQHGGYSGTESAFSLDSGDAVIEVTGYTGDWFGRNCVLQLTVKTRNGKTYGPFGTMEHASNTTPFSYQAPEGQSIIAFKGALIDVPLGEGPETTIVQNLSVSCA